MPVVLRITAIGLALATAALLVQLGRAAEPHPSALLLVARAITIGALFHVGLFLVPLAKRLRHRVAIAALMLPSVLIVVGLLGQTVGRLARGAPIVSLSTAIGIVGTLAYALAVRELARPPRGDA